jgi:steroid delta-isomerase-like uncharacterized protein
MDTQTGCSLSPAAMDRLIEAHLEAERNGDSAAAVAVYTDDVVHDVVGAPHGPLRGRKAAQGFYDHLIADIDTERMEPVRRYYGDHFCVMEHLWNGTIPGSFLGVPGRGKHISFRLLHVWEFRDGQISRENVWLDGGAIVHQLTAE